MFVIPEKINGFNIYHVGAKQVGITDEVKLPDIEEMTETISGPGILGEVDSPSLGLFGGMEMEIPFRVLFRNVFAMMSPLTAIALTLRGSIQAQDSVGNLHNTGMRVVVRGRKKGFTPGTVKQGQAMSASVKLELTYILIEIGGVVEMEIDKLNSVYKMHGIDMLAKVRALT